MQRLFNGLSGEKTRSAVGSSASRSHSGNRGGAIDRVEVQVFVGAGLVV
ncbi:MAG: hypothetical protein RID53_00050 [Coleofasciculus sp. B1-GNL1-01]